MGCTTTVSTLPRNFKSLTVSEFNDEFDAVSGGRGPPSTPSPLGSPSILRTAPAWLKASETHLSVYADLDTGGFQYPTPPVGRRRALGKLTSFAGLAISG